MLEFVSHYWRYLPETDDEAETLEEYAFTLEHIQQLDKRLGFQVAGLPLRRWQALELVNLWNGDAELARYWIASR